MTGIVRNIPPDIALALKRGIVLTQQMNAIKETQLKPLEDEFDGIKKKIQREMKKNNIDQYQAPEGSAKWIFNKGRDSFDEDELMKALKVKNLDAFKLEGKPYGYIRIFPKK